MKILFILAVHMLEFSQFNIYFFLKFYNGENIALNGLCFVILAYKFHNGYKIKPAIQ